MLAEQRLDKIMKRVEQKKSVTVQELMEEFQASESTIRRDLTALHNNGKLIKVHGGAIAIGSNFTTIDNDVESRKLLNVNEKTKIGKYAASLIEPGDFIYLDAGTTTEFIIPYIEEKNVVIVTNSFHHAEKLIKKNLKVYIIGGELKASTEAIVGNEAILSLEKYNFTKGFFGTNGVSTKLGFTTPDLNEALVKQTAKRQCGSIFVLADPSKFNQISPVTFAGFTEAEIITTKLNDEIYKECKNITEVTK